MEDRVRKYKRILLKISGESLAGEQKLGINSEVVNRLAKCIVEVNALGVEIALVVGGGNFWRGRSSQKMDRVTADHMGMLATTMNALAFSDALEQLGVTTRVIYAFDMRQICEPYMRRRAIRHLEKGRVIVLAGGTGNPYFSTDSAAALRASEIEADAVFKATLVDGVYDKDPNVHSDAVKFKTVSHDEVLQRDLGVMDATAAALCRDNKMPIVVFSIADPQNIVRIVQGADLGTVVS